MIGQLLPREVLIDTIYDLAARVEAAEDKLAQMEMATIDAFMMLQDDES